MENTEKTIRKETEALIKELESMNSESLHAFFRFFYKLNYQNYNTISPESFELFLGAFDKNPFKETDDKTFKKQLIDSILQYASDHMSLLTAAMLIKKKFTTDEIIRNYYSNVDVFASEWY